MIFRNTILLNAWLRNKKYYFHNMLIIRLLSLFFFVVFVSNFGFSQQKYGISIDSLNQQAISIYKSDPQKALSILNTALKKSESLRNNAYMALTKNNLGIVNREIGEFERAKTFSEEAVAISKDELVQASAYNNLGAVSRKMGRYQDAIEYYLSALKIYQEKNLEKEQATVNNNIGMVYSVLEMNEKAIEYHLKAKDFFEEVSDKKGISEAYNNIAIIYAQEGNFEEALSYFKHSLKVERELNDRKGIAESENNVGGVYYYMGKADSALFYFESSARIEKSIGNFSGVGASYNNIAQVMMENNQVKASKIYIDSAYYYASKSQTSHDVEMALYNYYEFYNANSDFKNSLKFYKNYSEYKDSILSLSNIQSLQELEIKYQTERKENEILHQRAQLAEKELEVRKKNTFIFGSLGLALVLGLIGYLLYNQQKLKNRQLHRESELKSALAKIETQNKLQEQRLRISRDLHDNIGAQLTFIISSIDNLKYGFTDIGQKLGDKLSGISSFTAQTIYELRDTIWAMNKENITFEDLHARIANFIEHAKNASGKTDFSFNLGETLDPGHMFSSVEGMNIYRIIQEAVNNALKYSNAEVVETNISKGTKQYHIEISDNGKGFDPGTVKMGNGLNNMKKRSREIGGQIHFISEINKGTKVILKFPIKK
ncbi:tetratricopeptide repeat protein [Aequorivita sp. H23M31]|uniref:Tetratricopeptide repeat protein n=1 Tax=Aequorivita ciconiae TaxID=2494375 RepID=A0A410G6I3_9FLAO|nr:sensor histidine kinase [Aequorivita sp. H23M31]QAA82831.1 tetratricopeptide repeat protein [Aequorivita sp. H23M31]